jgi:hypothetical protein
MLCHAPPPPPPTPTLHLARGPLVLTHLDMAYDLGLNSAAESPYGGWGRLVVSLSLISFEFYNGFCVKFGLWQFLVQLSWGEVCCVCVCQ